MDFIVEYTRCAIFCYTICSKFIIPNILFCYAICAFILYCIARESSMTHRFALLFLCRLYSMLEAERVSLWAF